MWKKTFYSVWHDALLHKLIQRGCNIFLARIIHSFLTFQISVGPSRPSLDLSPTLYNLFTSDAPTADGCDLATFADDTAIFVSNSEPMNVCDGLQSQLNSLTDYFKQWKIKVNDSKTQAIYFTRCWSPRRLPSTRIVLSSQEVPCSSEVKYLGVTLYKILTFTQ
jgi:hypothetical protein